MIRQKALKLQDLVHSIQEREQIHLVLFERWLENFKQRRNLRVFKSHGESGDADTVTLESALPNSDSSFQITL